MCTTYRVRVSQCHSSRLLAGLCKIRPGDPPPLHGSVACHANNSECRVSSGQVTLILGWMSVQCWLLGSHYKTVSILPIPLAKAYIAGYFGQTLDGKMFGCQKSPLPHPRHASGKLFAFRGTFWPTKLEFFVGHLMLSSVILDILSDDPGAYRQAFSNLIRHVRRDQQISGSLPQPQPLEPKPLTLSWLITNAYQIQLGM